MIRKMFEVVKNIKKLNIITLCVFKSNNMLKCLELQKKRNFYFFFK